MPSSVAARWEGTGEGGQGADVADETYFGFSACPRRPNVLFSIRWSEDVHVDIESSCRPGLEVMLEESARRHRTETREALWSAVACYRFNPASLLAASLPSPGTPLDGQQAGLSESGSKPPHSRAPAARKSRVLSGRSAYFQGRGFRRRIGPSFHFPMKL